MRNQSHKHAWFNQESFISNNYELSLKSLKPWLSVRHTIQSTWRPSYRAKLLELKKRLIKGIQTYSHNPQKIISSHGICLGSDGDCKNCFWANYAKKISRVYCPTGTKLQLTDFIISLMKFRCT